MDTEFTRLAEEIESYRNRMSTFYLHKPMLRKVVFKWKSEIEDTNLYNTGEEGAYIYLRGEI